MPRNLLKHGAGLLLIGFLLFQSLGVMAEEKPLLTILPFLAERENLCPVCKTIFKRGEILPHGPGTTTRLLYQKIESMETFTILPLERVEEALFPSGQPPVGERPLSSLLDLGRELRSDYLLIGYLFRFEERVGSSVGVERPASVGFDLHLFRVKDGKEVWRGRMDETQRPLSENLFKLGSFFRRKARWLTAEELASVGMDEVLRRFPGRTELEVRR